MFAHRHSQQFTNIYRNHLEHPNNPNTNLNNERALAGELRKKIQNYSFLVSDRIGKGYSSVVYKGINDLTGQTVAIKVIELKSLRDETSKLMLQTEIECFKETNHPNLLKYHSSFFTLNNCYIVTEYCEVGDLARLIKDRGALSQEEAGALFLQLYQGYLHFYQAGFIHRDLKPANIFVSADRTLKIADFGFSKRRSLVERENYNVGTPIYMPKESLTANIYNEKTDVWALGITLYELIFGCVPYHGKTEQDLKAEIERGNLHFPDHKPISSELRDFLACCLHNDSFLRISIREMLNHPFMRAVQKRLGERAQKNGEGREKEQVRGKEEETQMRISLPNQGVSHNKSREYFEKPPQAVDNRRSISSMQKLKLCHQKKGSQILNIPRQPLGNRSVGSINLAHKKQDSLFKQSETNKRYSRQSEDKQNQPLNRPSFTLSTLPSSYNLAAKSKPQAATQSNRLKVGIDKIVSLINYFRLLNKIIEKIRLASELVLDAEIKTDLSELNGSILKDLKDKMNLHSACLQTKSNIFGLNPKFWSQFVGSERWQMYMFVITKYQAKYEALLKDCPSKVDRNWRSAFIDFYSRVKQFEGVKVLLVKQKYALCQLSYYLQRLGDMEDLVVEVGWENFTERYSSTEEFEPQGFTINMANYYEMEERVRNKYISMKKKCTDIY